MTQESGTARKADKDTERFSKMAQACKARREMLKIAFSRNGSAYDKAGMINLGRVIYVFAARFIEPAIRPGTSDETAPAEQKELWEFQWYANYLTAVLHMGVAVQDAIRLGKLTPRKVTTRVPLAAGEPKDWLSLDIDAEMRGRHDEFWDSVQHKSTFHIDYPDGTALGPSSIGFDAEDVLAWLETERIASRDEAQRCFGYGRLEAKKQEPAPTTSNSLPAVLDVETGPGWSLRPLERVHVLSGIIYDILKAAHAAGEPCPTAQDVLDALARKPHPDVIEVTNEGVKYRSNSKTKMVDTRAIGKRIARLTA